MKKPTPKPTVTYRGGGKYRKKETPSHVRVGLAQRRSHNENLRANDEEPAPGCGRGTGVKRWSRYLKRGTAVTVEIKNPQKYWNSSRAVDTSEIPEAGEDWFKKAALK